MAIYGTYDQLKDIPADQWNDHSFYDKETRTYNLFGHYLRHLGKDPAALSRNKAMCEASHLVTAINTLIDLVLDNTIWDAYSMAEGRDSRFDNPDPKERALDILRRIEDSFPRKKYALSNDPNQPIAIIDTDDLDMLPLGKLDHVTHHVLKA